MINKNIILNTDSYKVSMWKQYPPNTESVYSYIESRGGRWLDEQVFIGILPYLMEYLSSPITQEMIDEAESVWTAHGDPFNREGWQYILDNHNGYLPLRIKAIPEGTVVSKRNILVSVENTDPKCFWLTTWIETSLLRAIWYATTVATQSREIKKLIKSYLDETSCAEDTMLDFRLHDFGARGVSSFESSGLGDMAHSFIFKGSDTITGALFAKRYYGEEMATFSIPASEHSTMTAWGEDNEVGAYRNMLKQFGGEGKVFACVSDSYDIHNASENIWGGELKQEVIDSGATVVIRPDSGTPWVVVSEVAELLAKQFGYVTNDKGYKVINNVRIIQGDGINYDSISDILMELKRHGFSAENVSFGMGGGLLQQLDRDTLRFAMKASAIKIDGKWKDVYKNPATDTSKSSKRGRLDLVVSDNPNKTHDTVPYVEGNPDSLMRTVWENGTLLVKDSFSEIRERASV